MGGPIVVTVPATAGDGVKTGVTVQSGDVFTVSGSGSAGFGGTRMTYPDGTTYTDGRYSGAYVPAGLALDGVPAGMLIARIGSGPWLAVGSRQTFQAHQTGEVTVAYNDKPSAYRDNSGEYSAMVENRGGTR
ncbi:LecA/PA-IL family lectin [Actinosynnema sp. NPDC047251]|uniref:Pa-i galactophilic lectin-like protein n=1 Tax=Saccharothrix espanaensis (strain ATCC 51144 / DSM 44229 / JCM 9112 / NBRC 15066 / NRRL 15764) TaxID=1179773 RepID=K0JZH6_SACES|nr:pa-i galactophilic lectin-like protein [Saccharothrix espanaensis]CCH30682.1 pa-i galactophilic lectin-like protein [Saccharothrix espanaensis DSM 44229]